MMDDALDKGWVQGFPVRHVNSAYSVDMRRPRTHSSGTSPPRVKSGFKMSILGGSTSTLFLSLL